jgi:hypothetical protein
LGCSGSKKFAAPSLRSGVLKRESLYSPTEKGDTL